MDPYVHEKGERRSARVGPRTTIVAQMFAFVKALRQKKRSGEGKAANAPGLSLAGAATMGKRTA